MNYMTVRNYIMQIKITRKPLRSQILTEVKMSEGIGPEMLKEVISVTSYNSSDHLTCFPWCLSVPFLYSWVVNINSPQMGRGESQKLVEYRLVPGSTESRTTKDRELELENWVGIPRWLKKKWQEDFIMIWSDSSCVEIRCQVMTSGGQNPSVCTTMNWKVCKSEIALYYLYLRGIVQRRCQ
jgi:hypothetical protein